MVFSFISASLWGCLDGVLPSTPTQLLKPLDLFVKSITLTGALTCFCKFSKCYLLG